MRTPTPTTVDQITAEKTKLSERLARLDADREKIATQLADLETPRAATAKSAGRERGVQNLGLGERVLALATGKTRQELYAACPSDRPNHVGIAVQRHIRAGRIQERDGKLYATPTATDQDYATA